MSLFTVRPPNLLKKARPLNGINTVANMKYTST